MKEYLTLSNALSNTIYCHKNTKKKKNLKSFDAKCINFSKERMRSVTSGLVPPFSTKYERK